MYINFNSLFFIYEMLNLHFYLYFFNYICIIIIRNEIIIIIIRKIKNMKLKNRKIRILFRK